MPPDPERRGRLRFLDFGLERFPDGRCLARVETEWTEGRCFLGEAWGTQTLEGELRASALAALLAVSAAGGEQLRLNLRGAKAIRAFDSWVVAVLVQAEEGEEEGESLRLLGAYPCPDEDTARGAVMAVLDATNRCLERYLTP